MKLRVRSPSGLTHRVDVPELCNIRTLRERVAAVAEIPVSDVRLSLNKQDEISGPSGIMLSSFGICGGDLLYMLSGSPVPADHVAVPTSRHPPAYFSASSQTPSSSGAIPSIPSAAQQLSSADVPKTGARKPSAAEEARLRREQCAASAARRLVAPESAEVQPESPAEYGKESSSDAVVQTKSMEIGILNHQGGSPEPLNLVPDPSASASSPLVESADPASRMETDAPSSEEEASSVSSAYMDLPAVLQRVLAAEAPTVHIANCAELLGVAIHAVMLETGLVLASPGGSTQESTLASHSYALPSGWNSGKAFPPFNYTLPSRHPVGCTLRLLTVGGYLVVYGITSGSKTPAVGAVCRLSLPVQSFCNSDSITEVGDHVEGDISGLYMNLRQLWKDVKDNLSVPLLTALCRQAGLEAPPSLLVLPTEVKMQILERLPAATLAACACVCSELRFLAGEDDIWRVLYERDFGSPVGSRPPGGGSWKRAYASKVQQRRQQEEERRQAEARLWHMAHQQIIPPRHPYYPAPGIIGGDYDRFPAIGGGGIGGGLGGPGFVPGGMGGGGSVFPLWPGQLADPLGRGGAGIGHPEGLGIGRPFGGRAMGEVGELPAGDFGDRRRPGFGLGLGPGQSRQRPRFPGSGGIM